ncbi:MAG TPA: DNA-binding protein [Methanothrix sp.]|nr:DNA-binding protein [Methanothrix sp.]
MKVILDTNALMVPEQFGVEIFSELERLGYTECLVPASVLAELRALASGAKLGKDKVAARVALVLAQRGRVLGEAGRNADAAIERLALDENAAVFTNDRALKKRLSSNGITVIYLRQERYLDATKKEI